MAKATPEAPKPRVMIEHSRWLSIRGDDIQLRDLEELARRARRLGYSDEAPFRILSATYNGHISAYIRDSEE